MLPQLNTGLFCVAVFEVRRGYFVQVPYEVPLCKGDEGLLSSVEFHSPVATHSG